MITRKGRRPETTLEDITHGFAMLPLWRDMAYEDIAQRYRNSYLGMAWLILSYAMFVGAIGVIFRAGFGQDMTHGEYICYLAAGYWLWTFIQGGVGEGAAVIAGAGSFVKGAALPLSLLFYRLVYRNLIALAITAIGLVGFLIYADLLLQVRWLVLLLALPIYCIAGFFSAMLFGSLCAQVPDIGQAVQTMMRLVFFLTPIIWVPAGTGSLRDMMATYNPFTYFLAIAREPILGQLPSANDYLLVLAFTAFLAVAGTVSFHLIRPRIALSL